MLLVVLCEAALIVYSDSGKKFNNLTAGPQIKWGRREIHCQHMQDCHTNIFIKYQDLNILLVIFYVLLWRKWS